jgi:hypothetical protein
MLLLLLIIPVWALGLAIVAGLCFTARIGDSELPGAAATERGESPAPAGLAVLRAEPQAGVERARSARSARELAA